ncbi:hypothetical protein LNP18_08650 [Leuconostoc citreum]|uniref:hypothetical protein n=1 Tax=Leuconostoc citreum TaxID=33964 RepID=UPI00200B4980|nr:hypothetical protein [Leuconostoc citreum]MCK8606171.1 hypothetical protein [Leuconostoc citreum]
MFTGNFNVSYKDSKGVEVATGYATLGQTVDVHLSVKDRVAYEADKANIDNQEADFRAKVIQVADIMGIATVDSKAGE